MQNRYITLLLLCLSALALVGCTPQQSVTLQDLLGSGPYAAVIDPEEDTDAVCDQIDGCTEGWVSQGAEYMRFSSGNDATAHAETLGDNGFQSNFLVIDWDGDVDPAQRQAVEELFVGAHQSE